MLNQLTYSVTFPSTGRSLSADVTFGPGMTAITGDNESGKSTIFEMARYLLFGTQALRGAAEDYKTLKASGSFTIKNNLIEIERTIRTATMKRNGVVVATGTTGVNQKVVQELGFGMAVFDVACSINQGEVEKLSDMKPAERKRMVESVLGLSILDNIAKWGNDEALIREKQAESLRERLVPPGLAPVTPADYEPAAELSRRAEALRAEAEELAGIDGFLSVQRAKPVKPECKISLPAAQLQQFAEKRAALRNQVAQLRAQVEALPAEAPYTRGALVLVEEQIRAYDERQAYDAWLRLNPPSRFSSVMQLEVFRDDWVALRNMREFEQLQARIDTLVAKGSKPCPHCGEDIPLEADAIKDLEAKRDALAVPPAGTVIQTPPVLEHEIDREIAYLRAYKPREAPPVAPEPSLTTNQVADALSQLAQVDRRKELEPTLASRQAEFEAMPDYETQLIERRAYEAALAAYHQEALTFESWQAERAQKEARRTQLAGAPARYETTRAKHGEAVAYEAALARHTETQVTYDKDMGVIAGYEAEAEDYRKVKTVMADLRGRIKSFVLPSLNKVASHLLYQMTGGQRGLIHINDDFEVMVDGQALNTLSGSGKACANLAIRIGLGQVLTNKVISLLMADEIDASMDDFRAENVQTSIGSLHSKIAQILLISHKRPTVEQVVRLGPHVENYESVE